MKWSLEWAPHIAVLERRARKGKPTPSWESRPFVEPEQAIYWAAFNHLHQARVVGWGPHPILVSDILAWCELNGVFDPEDRQDLFEIVQILDGEWLSWARKKSEKKPEKDKKNGHPGTRD